MVGHRYQATLCRAKGRFIGFLVTKCVFYALNSSAATLEEASGWAKCDTLGLGRCPL